MESRSHKARRRLAAALLPGIALLGPGPGRAQQAQDICGCANKQSLGAFKSSDSATWPAGTTRSSREITIPLPADGVLVFDSFEVTRTPGAYSDNDATIRFAPTAGNPAVTLLVRGDVVIGPYSGQGADYPRIDISGASGSGPQSGVAPGGAGGPGGFRGGDGANVIGDPAGTSGGEGQGPGGGAAATISPGAAANQWVKQDGGSAVYQGPPDLIPLIGGSGGGGGSEVLGAEGSSQCQNNTSGAPSGGGGGGAILIAANGTVRLEGASRGIDVSGGSRYGASTCYAGSGAGSGGAVRIVAAAIDIKTSGAINAIGGNSGSCTGGGASTCGRILLEAFTITGDPSWTTPTAQRIFAPGPLSNPFVPAVAIQDIVGGTVVTNLATPSGGRGGVDVTVSAPGDVQIDLRTDNVQEGTYVELTAKPAVGIAYDAAKHKTSVAVSGCTNGVCNFAGTLALDQPGTYYLQARATFRTTP